MGSYHKNTVPPPNLNTNFSVNWDVPQWYTALAQHVRAPGLITSMTRLGKPLTMQKVLLSLLQTMEYFCQDF